MTAGMPPEWNEPASNVPLFERKLARYVRRADRIADAQFREVVDYDAEHDIGDPRVETAAMIDEARRRNAERGIFAYDPVVEAEALLGGDDG